MLKRVLVANRGDIALRIVRACHDLGIPVVAAYNEADQYSMVLRLADDAICIGPATTALSYLNQDAIISAARVTGCDAIHPGYGFLAEQADFAERCAEFGIILVGPRPSLIRTMANKTVGRQRMQAVGIPVLPGSESAVQSSHQAVAVARSIGFPLMLKPSIGGGGRAMRVVFQEQDLLRSYATVRAESEAAFGHGDVLIEKYLPDIRHIEVQLLADNYGNLIHLGERDCSAQRRHQKIMEEAPSPFLTPDMRERIVDAALRGARALGYNNVGTMEFLVDPEGNFFFIEMNTRIQVGHPVTELLTGLDLVVWQLLVAGGEPLPFQQRDIRTYGHAIECRINAEDPQRDFLPEFGVINFVSPPGGIGVRVDTHLYSGYEHPRFSDTLIAKTLAWGQDRSQALSRMRRALNEWVIEGVATTIPFQLAMLDDPDFCAGNVSTRFVARMLDRWRNAA